MPKEQDFKRLVRARMAETGERYTQARVALTGAPAVRDEQARSLIGQLGDTGLAPASFERLQQLPEAEQRNAALFGLTHDDWRVRRSSARLLDDLTLTDESITALSAALDDPNPKVRRAALHTLSCVHCKPDGCALDTRKLFDRMIEDRSSQVRSLVVFTCSWAFVDQWAWDLLSRVAGADPSAELRAAATAGLDSLRAKWESDAARRRLGADLQRKTERHAGHWVAIRDGRIVAVTNGQHRVFRREVSRGAQAYWVPPAGAAPVDLPPATRIA